MSAGDFGTGLLQGIGQVMLMKQQQSQDADLKKLKKKKLLADFELQEQQQAFFGQLQEQPAQTITGQELPGPPVPPKAASLSELLATGPGQAQALQAQVIDIDGLQDFKKQQDMSKFFETLSQGGGQPGQSMADQFSPPSITAAMASQDPKLLKAARRETTDLQTDEGPVRFLFDKDRPMFRQEIGTPVEKVFSPEQAGKISGLLGSKMIANDLRGQILNDKGEVMISLFDLTNMATGTPYTTGRKMKFQFQDAIDSVVRARTGAAATEFEMKQLIAQMMPSPADDQATVVNKMDRLDRFVTGALDVVTLPKRIRLKYEAILQQERTSDSKLRLSDDENAELEALKAKHGL